jgi:hypothetical protein
MSDVLVPAQVVVTRILNQIENDHRFPGIVVAVDSDLFCRLVRESRELGYEDLDPFSQCVVFRQTIIIPLEYGDLIVELLENGTIVQCHLECIYLQVNRVITSLSGAPF